MPPLLPSSSSSRTTPLKRLAASTKTCAVPARAYGACILSTYMDVKKDVCKNEFDAFKRCLVDVMKRKW